MIGLHIGRCCRRWHAGGRILHIPKQQIFLIAKVHGVGLADEEIADLQAGTDIGDVEQQGDDDAIRL